jgi:outer membrane protein assembly factor BamB
MKTTLSAQLSPLLAVALGSCYPSYLTAGETAKKHAAAQPLASGAVSSDWTRFLGPSHQPVSPETKLLKEFPPTGPALVWECQTGEGYACPAIVGNTILLFFSIKGKECVECRDALTGELKWEHIYPIQYRDRYGYANGPRSGPVVQDGQVFTFGVTSQLTCLDLATGKVVWENNTREELGVPQYFFGSGASPLIQGENVILNLGGADELCVAAFVRKTGKISWKMKHAWGQSYASPIPATLQGQSRVLVFAGGESQPSTGGLICLDPKTGAVDDTFPWRATRYSSVNAASPCLAGENRVLVTQSYVDTDSPCNGAVLLELTAERKWKEVWKNPLFGCHWMTPVFHQDHFYAFSGEKEDACELICVAAKDGKQLWHERPTWEEPIKEGRTAPMGYKRASILKVDGHFLVLGEWGTLAWMDLSPEGMKVTSRAQLFVTPHTWTLPAISHGLMYVLQTETDLRSGSPPRVLCYDLRGK